MDGLNMSEVVGDFTGRKQGPTFFRGSKPIDRVWASHDILVTHACVMPAGFGVGDHRMFVIDFQEASLVGTEPFRAQQFASRRLNTMVWSGATRMYIERLEENLARLCLTEMLGTLHIRYKQKRHFQRAFNKLDQQSKELMINAEKNVDVLNPAVSPSHPRLLFGFGALRYIDRCCDTTTGKSEIRETLSGQCIGVASRGIFT